MTTDRAAAGIADLARRMPKISLHVHLLGSVEAQTVVDLARRHDAPLPGDRDATTLYDVGSYSDLANFLQVYDVVGSVVRDAADFHRITYETLALAASHGVLYREMFVSPQAHPDVPYPELLEGVTAGIRDASADHGVICRLIMAINRERTADEAVDLIETMIAHPCDEVIGIGLDYAEVNGPPERFADAFALAAKHGLKRTAHSETGPPEHIETILDVLGCSRVDHGYHVTRNERITRRCRDDGITFTCTPVSSDVGRYSGSGNGTHHSIARMIDAGLAVTIDSDDPPMFATDPTNDYQVVAAALGLTQAELIRFTYTALNGCWLDDTDRASLRRRVDSLFAELLDEEAAPGPQ